MPRALWRAIVIIGLVVLMTLPLAALEVRVPQLAVSSTRVVAMMELRDLLRDRFLQVVGQGRAVFVQIQADLWENRRVADRLVFTTAALTYRIDRRVESGVVVTDQSGARFDHPDITLPVQVRVDLGPAGALLDASSYYVQAEVTAATVEERELEQAGAAFLGDPQSAEGLAGLGRFVFRTLLRLGQYLDTVSVEATSQTVTGATIRATAN